MKHIQKMIRRSIPTLLFAVALMLLVTVAEACPTCKNGIAENSTEQAQIVRGYFWSILFMMSMPFLILGTFSSCMYLSVRNAKKRQEAERE